MSRHRFWSKNCIIFLNEKMRILFLNACANILNSTISCVIKIYLVRKKVSNFPNIATLPCMLNSELMQSEDCLCDYHLLRKVQLTDLIFLGLSRHHQEANGFGYGRKTFEKLLLLFSKAM